MDSNFYEILVNAFWEDIGSIIRPDNLDNTIYHYTSLEGLMGILSSEEVWMTNSNFLNDMSELTYFKAISQEVEDSFKKIILSKYGEEKINRISCLNILLNYSMKLFKIGLKNPMTTLKYM